MKIFGLLIFIFWLIFVIYWLISALGAKKSTRGKLFWKGAWVRVVLIVVVLILIHFGVFGNISYQPAPTTTSTILLGIIGVFLCLAGFAFAVWARVYIGKNWGMPMTLQEGHELVTSGPYALVRHPIYTGFLLAMLGSVLVTGTVWFVILIISGTYFIYSAKVEEKIMTKQFPNEYPAYMKKTKMLIPFIL